MPIVTESEVGELFLPQTRPITSELVPTGAEAKVTMGERADATGSAFMMFNPLFSVPMSDSTLSIFDDYDPQYEPEEDINPYFEKYKSSLLMAKNQKHMDRMKNDILRKEKYETQLQNGGATGVVATLAAGVLDPVNLIPINVAGKAYMAKSALTLSKAQKARAITTSAAKTSAAAAGSVAISEALLQISQPALEAEESIKAIAGGAILGGLLGGGAKTLSIKKFEELGTLVKKDFEESFATAARVQKLEDSYVRSLNETGGVGAAAAQKLTKADLELVNTFGLAKLTKFINPTLRVMQAQSRAARELYSNMVEVPLKIQAIRNGKAAPTAVETLAKNYDTGLARAVTAERAGYKAHKATAKKSGQQAIPRQEYKKRVAQALRRGDEDIMGDPDITKAAKEIRREFLEPMKKEAIDAGVLPEDVEARFADSYLTRMWNPKAIRTNTTEFKNRLMNWAMEKTQTEIDRIKNYYGKREQSIKQRINKEDQLIAKHESRLKELGSKQKAKFDYRNLSSVQDDYLEFMKRDIGLQEVGAYLARNELEGVAELVNSAIAKIPKEPESLVSAIIKKGGIKPDGDLTSMGITNKSRVGLFSNNGLGLDVMLRDLADDGFFPEYKGTGQLPDDFMVDDLRRAIRDDLFERKIVRDQDIEQYQEVVVLRDLQDEAIQLLDEIGFTDYKNFYKNIYEELRANKRDLRKATKVERERIKAARQGGREAQKAVKPLLQELKRMRNAESATLRREIGKAQTRKGKLSSSLDEEIGIKNMEVSRFLNASNDDITEYASDIVDEVTEILAQTKPTPDIPSYITPIRSGPLKGKTLDVNDIDFEDFLENDVRHIMEYYRHNMGTQIEMNRKMREFGYEKFDDWLEDVNRDYRAMEDALPDGKEKTKIQREKEKVLQDIKDVHELMHGRYGNLTDPDDVLSQGAIFLRDLQFMAKMGGVTLSSMPDVMRAPMVSGFENTFDALKMKAVSKELKALTNAELEEIGLNIESVLASRLQTLAEIGDPTNRGSALTRFTGNAANVFSKVTLINYWNDMQKSVAGLAHQKSMLKALAGKGSQEVLLESGFDKGLQKIAREQIAKYGGDGLSGIKNWDVTDPNVAKAARTWKAAIRRISDTAIVTKGAGDLPIRANTQIGRLFLQFRSFMIASHNRVLLRALQTGQQEAAGAVMASAAMVGMGMLVAATKAELAMRSAGLRGSETNYDTSTWNKRRWIVEGVDRSGIIALMLEPLNIADKAWGLGPSLITGQGVTSRFGSRNVLGALMGPTAGTIGDIGVAGRAAFSPITGADISKGDIYAARRILPYQNAFIFRQMFDILERETGEALGVQ